MPSPLTLRLASVIALVSPLAGCFDPTQTPGEETDATSGAQESSGSEDPTTASTASSTSPGTTAGTSSPSTSDASASDTDPSDGDTDVDDPSATDPSDTTDGGSEDETSATGDPSCDGQCVPEVPQGWQGPVVVYDDVAPAPACPGAFPQAVHTDRHAGLEENAAICDCECGDVSGASCGAATLREEGNFCAQFIIDAETHVLQPGACAQINTAAGEWSLSTPVLQTAGASCLPDATEQIASPTWARDVRSCATAAGDACDGGTCFPDTPADHAMCIFVEGEAACPDGPWSTVHVSHTDFTDERDCTTCSCGDPIGECGGSATLTQGGCGGGVIFVDSIATGGCGPLEAASHATFTPVVEADCAPSNSVVSGEVTTSGAVTYCCL